MKIFSYLTFVERLLSPFLLSLTRPISIKLWNRPASTSVSGIDWPFISWTVCSETFLETFFFRLFSFSSGSTAGRVDSNGISSLLRLRLCSTRPTPSVSSDGAGKTGWISLSSLLLVPSNLDTRLSFSLLLLSLCSPSSLCLRSLGSFPSTSSFSSRLLLCSLCFFFFLQTENSKNIFTAVVASQNCTYRKSKCFCFVCFVSSVQM